jgi:hypothetical protein
MPTRIQGISMKSLNLQTKVTSLTRLQKNHNSFYTKHKILTVQIEKEILKVLSK